MIRQLEELLPNKAFYIYRGIGGGHTRKPKGTYYVFREINKGIPGIVVSAKEFDELLRKVIMRLR